MHEADSEHYIPTNKRREKSEKNAPAEEPMYRWRDFARKRHPLRVSEAQSIAENWWASQNVKNLPKIGDRVPRPRYYWQSIGADGQVSRFLPAELVSLPFLFLAVDDVGGALKKMKRRKKQREKREEEKEEEEKR